MGTAVLVLTLMSHHFRYERDFNERNPGVGIELPISGRPGYHVGVGGYDNSQSRLSIYALAGRGWTWGGVDVGAVTGYQYAVLPIVAPYLKLGPVKVSVLPTPRPVLGVQLYLGGKA